MRRNMLRTLAAAAFLVAVACTSDKPAGGVATSPTPAPTASATATAPGPTPVATAIGSTGAPGGTPTPAGTTPPVVSPPLPRPTLPAASTPTAPTATPTPPGSDRRVVNAPIENVQMRVAESFPPQYFLDVTSGLPGGCAKFYRYDVARAGQVVTVTVLNTMPVANTPCTAIYGYVQHAIPLGSNFSSGLTYTVHVNDKQISFSAQ